MIDATLTQILAEAAAALDGLTVTVTADPHEAMSSVMAGAPALLVLSGPAIQYVTVHRRTATWTAWAITPTDDPAEATAMFEPILDALAPALGLDRAQPETYDIRDRVFPGYTLTFTPEHN